MFVLAKDNKLWFSTNNTKDVYKDMQKNPYIEISITSPQYAWLRLNGKVVFEENKEIKEACMNNPIFKVFYLENPHGTIADFSGKEPYVF